MMHVVVAQIPKYGYLTDINMHLAIK